MGNSQASSASNMEVREFIQNEINKNDVVIFSKSYCGYCTQTKQTFQSKGITSGVTVHELDRIENGSGIQQELAKMTNQRTVPNVFVKGQHIGGNDNTQRAFSTGEIEKLLNAN
mmetsp:Transcript_11617/g.17057  ORF Transcript_11617/g.17057 Transcript_11617/m.17057 type:complete len:114 (-) Transcript_11617:111-452(-)